MKGYKIVNNAFHINVIFFYFIKCANLFNYINIATIAIINANTDIANAIVL